MKFKAGDKVKILTDLCWGHKGSEGTIHCYDNVCNFWWVTVGTSRWPYLTCEIELIETQLLFDFMHDN